MSTLSRRQLVQGAGAVGLGLLAGCGRLPGQTPPISARTHRLGFIGTEDVLPTLRQALGALGYVEGQNLTIHAHFARGPASADAAAELIQVPVDVIVTTGISTTLAASRVTSLVPIVQARGGGDLVARGVVVSLAQPGGNVTGVTELAPQLAGKRLELLRETVPDASQAAVLWNVRNPENRHEVAELQLAAQALGIHLQAVGVQGAEELDGAFEAASRERVGGLVVVRDGFTLEHEARIAALALEQRLPSMYEQRSYVAAGGLLAYGARGTDSIERAALYVDRILKGTKPADLPIEQPMRFDFAINLKTAQALGLTIPHHVLLQATEVIQ